MANLFGDSDQVAVAGVKGEFKGKGGGPGVEGFSSDGNGVRGDSTANHGVHGESITGRGVHGISQKFFGVSGVSTDGVGVSGESSKEVGVLGKSTSSFGVKGISEANHGVHGESRLGRGVVGVGPELVGVQGESKKGVGVNGLSESGDGVFGTGRRGVVGVSPTFQGVFGKSGDNAGVVGESDRMHGVFGITHSVFAGVFGASDAGGTGVAGESKTGVGIHGKGGRLAGLFEGDVEVTGDIRLANADCAEDFDVVGAVRVEPGTVMVLGNQGALSESHHPYDKRVAGVISGAGNYKPGIVMDKQETSGNRQPVALMGKVFCKVDAQFGAIEVGDLLTTSPTPGHAMKTNDPFKAFGAVIGKALRPLKDGQGLIPILIALQ
ncbi:MAG: hypothetical protein WAM70_17090 [Pyrinomonadaceae bacterium]